MLRFRLVRGGEWMKHYRKMKWSQRACLGSTGRKRDTVQRRDNAVQRRDDTSEGKREETTSVGLTRNLLGYKMKKINVVDSAGTNGR
jgi:hypothetical protein